MTAVRDTFTGASEALNVHATDSGHFWTVTDVSAGVPDTLILDGSGRVSNTSTSYIFAQPSEGPTDATHNIELDYQFFPTANASGLSIQFRCAGNAPPFPDYYVEVNISDFDVSINLDGSSALVDGTAAERRLRIRTTATTTDVYVDDVLKFSVDSSFYAAAGYVQLTFNGDAGYVSRFRMTDGDYVAEGPPPEPPVEPKFWTAYQGATEVIV